MTKRNNHSRTIVDRRPLEFLTVLLLTFSCVAAASAPT